jgi:hypothetical protein
MAAPLLLLALLLPAAGAATAEADMASEARACAGGRDCGVLVCGLRCACGVA